MDEHGTQATITRDDVDRATAVALDTVVVKKIVPGSMEIVDGLSAAFRRWLESGLPPAEFVRAPEIKIAWQTLARVYKVNEPIRVKQGANSSEKNYLLFLRQCGNDASVGTISRGSRLCGSCHGKAKRMKEQKQKRMKV